MARDQEPRRADDAAPTESETSRLRTERTTAPEHLPFDSQEQGDLTDDERSTTGPDVGAPSARRIVGAFSQQLVFRMFGMVASIVMLALTARHLGETSYGHLTAAILFISLWTSLTELGIGAVIVRRVTGGEADLERLVRINTGISIIYTLPLAGIAIGSGVLIYSAQGSPEVVHAVQIIGIGLALTTVSSCLNPVFLATVRFQAVALADFLGRVLSLALTVYLVRIDAGVTEFALVQLVPPVVVLVVQGIAASRLIDWRPVFALRESWDLIRESLPQTAVLVIGVLYWRLDGVVLSLLGTPAETGTYYIAYSLAFTLTLVTTFFATSTLSTMTRFYAENPEGFGRFTARSVEVMLFLGIPVAVIGSLVSHQVIELVASKDYVAAGGPTLAVLCVTVAVTFVNAMVSQALFAAYHQIWLLRLNIVTLVLNSALNFVLIPAWGAVGAALALLAADVVGLIAASLKLSRETTYRVPWGFVLRLLVPTALASAAALLVLVDVHVVIALTASALVYLGANALLGPVRPSMIRELMSRE